MNDIKIIKEKMDINCDLSIVSLKDAIDAFDGKFGFSPTFVTIIVSVDDIFSAFEVRMSEIFNRSLFGIPIYFRCDREAKEGYWEVIGWPPIDFNRKFKDGILVHADDNTRYILYSEGT